MGHYSGLPEKGRLNRSKHERSEQVRVPVETRQPNLDCPTALATETGPKHKRSYRAALEIPWQRGFKTCVNARACFESLSIPVNGQCQPPLLFKIAVRGKNTRKFAKHLNSYYVLKACGLHCTRQKTEKHVSNLLKVCGLDPGTLQTAVVVWNGTTILDHQIIPNIKVIDYLTHTDCPVVACEHLQCYGMAVGKEVFETGYWIGRYWQVCDLMEIDWQRVFRSEIKAYWCHSLKAADSNIRAAIIDRLGKPGTKKAPGITYDIHKDLWSALAIAVRAHDLKISVPPP